MQDANQQPVSFNKKDVEILNKETLFKGFFRMVKYRFKHKRFAGGWSEPVEREMFERGHAAAMLPYDPIRDQVVIIEQIPRRCARTCTALATGNCRWSD